MTLGDYFEHDRTKPLVLLLGGVNQEGVVSALSAAGRQYKQKYPESQPENWARIIKHFGDFSVREVIWKLSPGTYSCLSSPSYEEAREELLPLIAAVPHVAFIHEELFDETHDEEGPSFDELEESGFDRRSFVRLGFPSKSVRKSVHELLERHGINVMPYQKNAELTVMASEFIANTEQGLLLRVYVPSGRMWSQETDRLLQLFRDYLGRIGKLSIRLDQKRTDRGIIYEFHGDEPQSPGGLSAEFEEFSHFLDLCVAGEGQAGEILSQKGIAAGEIEEVLTRYRKEAKRLHVDMKHDRERKVLGIRQRLESELVDISADKLTMGAVEKLVDTIVPSPSSVGSAIALDQRPAEIVPTPQTPAITVNLQPQIVQSVTGVVAQELRGNVVLKPENQQLLSLINDYGGTQSAELASCVHEIADPSAPKPGRLLAKQKLKKFLLQVGSKATDVGVGLLQKYLEGQLGL